jgi:hypothetical protein
MGNIQNYIVVDKTEPKRILAIVDEAFAAWFKQNLPALDTIEAQVNYGHVIDSAVGRFDYVSTKTGQVMLTSKPEEMSLGEAYKYVMAHLNR